MRDDELRHGGKFAPSSVGTNELAVWEWPGARD